MLPYVYIEWKPEDPQASRVTYVTDRLCMLGWSDYECRLFVSYSPLHHVDLTRQRMEGAVRQKYIA